MLMPIVAPSGAALATVSVARLPLAPGLFSTRDVLPGYFFDRPSATSRATISGVDPGPNGTRMRTVLAGQSCARPGRAAAQSKASETAARLNNAQIRAAIIGLIRLWDAGCIGP